MSALPEAVSLGLAPAHYLAAAGDRRALSLALASGGRRSEPARLCLEAAIAQHDADLDRCVALFRRALFAAEGQEKAYVTDLLAPIFVTQNRLDEAEALLEVDYRHSEFEAARLALKAVCLARRGEVSAAQALRRSVERMDCSHSILIASRVAQRLALSCFYSHDYEEDLNHSDRCGPLYASIGADRLAAGAYSISYIIHHTVTGDILEARRFAELITSAAQRGGDTSYVVLGLAAQYEIAAEMADEKRLLALRALLRREARPGLYKERFAARLADFIPFAWSGDFGAFRSGIVVVADALATTLGMKSLCLALESLALLAMDDRENAARTARRALHLAGQKPAASDSAFERRYRRLGRALAAVACLLLGDRIRGKRALATKDAQSSLESSALEAVAQGDGWTRAPQRIRGYARIVEAARRSARKGVTHPLLTTSELAVLRSFADGMTVAQIARDSGRSVHTVRNHTASAMQKLRARDRLSAVAQARRNGLL